MAPNVERNALLERLHAALGRVNHETLIELVSVAETAATPAVWDAAAGTLACPHCGWVGIVGPDLQPGRYGRGFRYAEDASESRDLQDADQDAGAIVDGTLRVAGDTTSEGEGRFPVLECLNCLHLSAIPECMEIDFV